MLPQFDAANGALPSGRYAVTTGAFASQFADISDHRKAIWHEWEAATALLREHIKVCAAWIGGSYLTTKESPNDIDCLYIVDADHIEDLSDESRRMLEAFAGGHRLFAAGLRVDSYVLPWVSNSTPQRANEQVRGYHEWRGYWDDLWSKMRSGPKGSAPTRLDSHPRRGYVEVILDGYSEEGPVRTS